MNTQASETKSTIFKYGDLEIDRAKLPATSDEAMFRRGLSHYLGSEQASKVTGLFKPDAEGKIKAEVEDTPENRATLLAGFQAKAIDALLAGTVGVSVRGPTVDPISVIVNRLAKAEVSLILKAHGVKTPAKAEDTVTTPDGSKHTMAVLVSRRLDPTLASGVDKKTGVPHLDRLTKDAKRIAAEQAKKAEKALAEAKGEGLAAL